MKTKIILITFAMLALASISGRAATLGTEFTYQGRLTDAAGPSSGAYDFTFTLHLAASGGVPIVTVTNLNTAVSNGLFIATVDFGGGIYNGNAYWISIGVRSNGTGGSFTPLTPRQPLTPTPNASYASLAGTVPGGSITAAKLAVDSVTVLALQNNAVTAAKVATGQLVKSVNGLRDDVLLSAGPNVTITPSGNTLTIAGSSAWNLGGNAGTTPGVNFLGTTDNQPLQLKVNNTVALQITPGVTMPNVVGGLAAIRPSVIASGVSGAVIAGGNAPSGAVSGFGGGDFQAVYDNDGTVGGGFGNKVGNANADVTDAAFATVAGGVFNGAMAYAATVAGGDGNFSGGSRSFVGGGYGNVTSGDFSMLGGGQQNLIQPGAPYSTIAGGMNNFISTNSPDSTISGGQNNSISPGGIGYVSAKGATIGGGEGNTVFGLGGFPEGPLYDEYGTIGGGYSNTVNASYGTVPGGYFNTASGDFSFAAGSRAKAVNYGSFVWADSQSADFSSTANNQVSFRCLGGARFTSGAGGANQTVSWTPGSASWSFSSDRALKEGFEAVDGLAVLEKVAQLPISEWNYKGYPQRHIGTMAQDFHAAFPLNESTTTLNDADLHGVALAAIQGLNQKVVELKTELHHRDAENAELRQQLAEIKETLQHLANGKGR